MRKSRLRIIGLVALAATLAGSPAIASPATEWRAVSQAVPDGSENSFAREYYRLLLEHTRWAETTWDPAAGHYQLRDYYFTVVLGNAVLLKFGDYDASLAGVSKDVLLDHTTRTIRHFAASNRWVNSNGDWGRNTYWDSTFETFFVDAARLMWSELDPETRENVDTITRRGAEYLANLGADNTTTDGRTSNGIQGAYKDNSRIEEMGAKALPLGTAAAFLGDDPSATTWREWMNSWLLNLAGLPPADESNPAEIDGRTVAEWNRAHNIFDTFIVENHGSYAPHYQESGSGYAGVIAIQFLIAGKPIPESVFNLPNANELWDTLAHLGTDSGVAAHLMVGDRHHLYGRDLGGFSRALLKRDPYAARAERMLLDHLGPYLHYQPEYRLTKFSGAPHYEPAARAELAMAYLLHYWRDRIAGDVNPVSTDELFARYSRARDYGADVGLIAQQSRNALAAAVTKPGFVKFAYLPQHDDWLFNVSHNVPSLVPSTSTAVRHRSAHEYMQARDGFDGSATLLSTPDGYAGFTTLPDGQAVYATSGLAANEGALTLHNLTMPGVPGLDGNRTFTWDGGSATLDEVTDGDGGEDVVSFDPVTARYVRFLGVERATHWGYSLWDFEVRDGESGPDLAVGKSTTASSTYGAEYPPQAATDADPNTRWAVSQADWLRNDSWLAVDLGEPTRFDRVRLRFDPAFGIGYRIQVSDDGQTWREAGSVGVGQTYTVPSQWLNVDGRAGFLIRGSSNPVSVRSDAITLSAGPAQGSRGMVVEARPMESADQTAAAAQSPVPSGGPAGLRASLAGGYLSLFNLSDSPISGAALDIPQDGQLRLYQGSQRTTASGTSYETTIDAQDARIEAPRFILTPDGDDEAPPPLRIHVRDSRAVSVENLAEQDVARLRITTPGGERAASLVLRPGEEREVEFPDIPLTPSPDVACGRTTYPTSPLPEGMSDPDAAVDGSPATSWQPGPGGRMVVDLGTERPLGTAELEWTNGRSPGVTVSVGVPVGVGDGGEDVVSFDPVTARYVRFLGVERATPWGYSLWDFEVRDGEDGRDLAAGKSTTASSYDLPYPPQAATDADADTRWAVSRSAWLRNDSWLAVDLGEATRFDRVRLRFDPAFAVKYKIQVSDDGQTWRDAAAAHSDDDDGIRYEDVNSATAGGNRQRIPLGGAVARYVAITTEGWQPTSARLAALGILTDDSPRRFACGTRDE